MSEPFTQQTVTPQTDHNRNRSRGWRSGLGRGRAALRKNMDWSRPIMAESTALVKRLTYASQRLLTRHSLAREFSRSQISKPPFANEIAPLNEEFKRLQAGGFADWRLSVTGMVARPASFSLAQLKSYPVSEPNHHGAV